MQSGAPPSIANQGDKTIWLDKGNLTTKIRRQTKNNIWAHITGRTKFPGSTEQVESDFYRGQCPELNHKVGPPIDERSAGLIHEVPDEVHAKVAEKLEGHFCANHLVKRRDPAYYIKNPSRVYAVSLGKNHYTINKMAKETFLSK